MVVAFELDGQPYVALNGGPQFTFDEAVSFQIDCDSQEEADYYWDALSRGRRGGAVRLAQGPLRPVLAGRPRRQLLDLMADPDQERGQRAMAAMLA